MITPYRVVGAFGSKVSAKFSNSLLLSSSSILAAFTLSESVTERKLDICQVCKSEKRREGELRRKSATFILVLTGSWNGCWCFACARSAAVLTSTGENMLLIMVQ